jgi:hypothetical protein
MLKNFEDIQALSQQNADLVMKSLREWNRTVQVASTEMMGFAARSFEEGASAFEAMLAAKSIEQIAEIQAGFLKRRYEECVTESGKIGSIYASLAKDAFKPLERVMSLNGRGGPLLRREERAQQ